MIESTLWFDDVEVIPGLLPFSGQFKGHVCGQENGAGDGLGTRLCICQSVTQTASLCKKEKKIFKQVKLRRLETSYMRSKLE